MPRLFTRRADVLFRAALWGLPLGFVGVATAATIYSHSDLNLQKNQPVHQTVPFSHRHHVRELGIDCRYCHTSVESSSFAGIPSTKVCMSCHSMVWTNSPLLAPVRESWNEKRPLVWNRVNDLPEFVYFDHSIHIARGVSCNDCHGPVQDMALTAKSRSFTMAWCLKCHRDPGKYVQHFSPDPSESPRQQVFDLYWRIQAGRDLTPLEAGHASGNDLVTSDPNAGFPLVRKDGIRTAELADCVICHR